MVESANQGKKHGGKRIGAGRPKGSTQYLNKSAGEIVRMVLQANAERLSSQYIKRAVGKYGDRVLCHAIDKLLPDERLNHAGIIIQSLNFVKFDNNHDSISVHAAELSSPVLESNAIRDNQESGSSLASESGEGQISLKFYDKQDVS